MLKNFYVLCLKFLCIGLCFYLYSDYVKQDVKLQKDIPVYRYCQENNDDFICKDRKFDNFFFIYLDGVGKFFLDKFQTLQQNKTNIYLQQIKASGIADSIPQFYSYFSGKVSMNYEVTLSNQDNFFQQCFMARKYPKTFISDYLDNVVDKKFQIYNTKEGRGLHYQISKNFLEWHQSLYLQSRKDKRRIIDRVYYSKNQALIDLQDHYKFYVDELDNKKKELWKDLDMYFKDSKNSFVYIDQIDDFSHWETQLGKNYVKAIAIILANINSLMQYIDQKLNKTLLITMSDHGGDETTYAQENLHHNSPKSQDNQAFFMLYNQKLIQNKQFADNSLESNQIFDVLSNLIKDINTSGWFNIQYEFFKNSFQKIRQYKAYENRLLFLQDYIYGVGYFDKILELLNFNLKNYKYRQQSLYKKMSLQTFNKQIIEEYKHHLIKFSKDLELHYKNKNLFCQNVLSRALIILVYFLFIQPLLFEMRYQSLLYLTHFILNFIWIIAEDINENYMVLFGFFYLLVCTIYNKNKKLFILIMLLNISIVLFYQVVNNNYQNVFQNSNNFDSLFLSYIIYFSLYLYLLNKEKFSGVLFLVSNTNLLAFAFLNLFYDYIFSQLVQFEQDQLTRQINTIQQIMLVLSLFIVIFQDQKSTKLSIIMITLNFSFYIENLYSRILVMYVMAFYYFILKNEAKNLLYFERQILYTCLFWTGYISYLVSGFYFDWRSNLRLGQKFDYLGLYRPLFMYVVLGIIVMIESDFDNVQQKYSFKCIDFVQGIILIGILSCIQFEYRNACSKLLEFSSIYYGVFTYLKLCQYQFKKPQTFLKKGQLIFKMNKLNQIAKI